MDQVISASNINYQLFSWLESSLTFQIMKTKTSRQGSAYFTPHVVLSCSDVDIQFLLATPEKCAMYTYTTIV